jgi:hypothetical protein
MILVEGKKIHVALLLFVQSFGFGYFRADVLDDAPAFAQVSPGEAA